MPRSAVVHRDHLLDVACRLFSEQGVRATGVAEIIAEAGCGKQALYRIFAGKDDLVAAYLERVGGAQDERADEAARAAGEDPAEQLVALIAQAAAWAGRSRYHGCPLRDYLRENPDADTKATAVAEAFLRVSRSRIHTLAAAVRPDDAQRLARQVWIIHEGLFNSCRATTDELSPAVDLVAALVWP